jgi:hypothetical protein
MQSGVALLNLQCFHKERLDLSQKDFFGVLVSYRLKIPVGFRMNYLN